jgi:hypothetical protein
MCATLECVSKCHLVSAHTPTSMAQVHLGFGAIIFTPTQSQSHTYPIEHRKRAANLACSKARYVISKLLDSANPGEGHDV